MSTYEIEVEPGAFNELRNALRRLADQLGSTFERELTDGRTCLNMGTVVVTTPMLHCPDCAARLQNTGATLKFIRHVT